MWPETIASIEGVHPWRKSSGPDTKTRGTDAEPRGLESVPPKLKTSSEYPATPYGDDATIESAVH